MKKRTYYTYNNDNTQRNALFEVFYEKMLFKSLLGLF